MDQLIYDEEYLCFFKDEFIGVATFTDDACIGGCFTKMHVHKKRGLEEIIIMPDSWVLKIEENAN